MYEASAPILPPSEASPLEPKQSKVGIASFIVSLIGVLLFCIGFVVSFVYGASAAMINPANPQVDTNSPAILIAGVLMCLSMVILVAALVLGIVAMTRKDEKKGFGIAGLVISALILIAYCALTVIGMMAQSAL
jgi:uncharacterized BrkB/YihY/UPF0761 family membrane protein